MNTTVETNASPLPLPVAEPRPLESPAPPEPAVNTGREWEKGQYWNRLLTGDPATVPAELRRKAGADDPAQPLEEREYRLVSTINRSWVVDHKGLSREQVRSEWPALRRSVAQELGVPDNEDEVFAALSVQNAEAPRREEERRAFQQHYEAALRGEPAAPEPDELATGARKLGMQTREQFLPLAEALADGWSAISAQENQNISLPAVVQGAPGLWHAVDALAELEPAERARVYAVARSLEQVKSLESEPADLLPAMGRVVRRSIGEIRHGVVQGTGHILAAMTRAAGESLDSDTLREASEAADKRLQVLHELRRVAQGEVFPIELKDENMYAQLALDAAGSVPGAALAFAGGAGFGLLALAGTGAAVAEARRLAPQGRQELQTAAGVLGGALQAGIFQGMSSIGKQMLSRAVNRFLQAKGNGTRAYALALLKSLGSLTAENVKLLLAGKAATAAGMGTQELAARVDHVASHIDWEQYGSDFFSLEANMREAAMNLPFVLIAAGRAALHHFRSPDSVLGDSTRLAEWGVDKAAQNRLLEMPDIHTRSAELQRLLSSSRRWSAPGSLPDWVRSLSLLNTANLQVFRTPGQVAEFLNLPAAAETSPAAIKPLSPAQPERMLDAYERMTGRRAVPLNAGTGLPYAQLWEEWFQRANGELRLAPADRERRIRFYRELTRNPELVVPREVQKENYYLPYREEAVRLLVADRVTEIKELSYRMLTNLETLDSLRRTYKSVESARKVGDALRRRVVSQLLMAFRRAVAEDSDPQVAFDYFCEQFGDVYGVRRSRRAFAPTWLRQSKFEDFQGMGRRVVNRLRYWKNLHPRLAECYEIMLGMRRSAESLIDLLPHADSFQAHLANGRSPEHAYAAVLQQEFRNLLDPDVWEEVPPLAEAASRESHQSMLSAYSAVSGHAPESSPDGAGGLLWRIRRPDSRYTAWYASMDQAVNELVGNVRLMFLPQGKSNFTEQMQEMYRDGRPYFRDRLLLRPGEFLTGFERLGRESVRELQNLWQSRATRYSLGLEFVPDFTRWLHLKGPRQGKLLKSTSVATNQYAMNQSHMLDPLQLAQRRCLVYWNRQLLSGWVSPGEAADLLVQFKALTRAEADSLLRQGGGTGAARHRLVGNAPGFRRSGDAVLMCHRLAGHMAELNLAFMMHEMSESGLPQQVQQWFSMAPFCYEDSTRPLRMSFSTAAGIKRLVPLVNELHRQKSEALPGPLAELMREAYKPALDTRIEQGWCYAIGSEASFRGAGQQYWNMLRDPVRGYSLLTSREREHVNAALRPLCGERPVSAAIQELSEVLQQYPELRHYGRTERSGNTWHRLLLTPEADLPDAGPVYTQRPGVSLVRPLQLVKDYTLEPVEALPPEWQADARVMPALQLLGELRTLASDMPYADAEGIRWRNARYGCFTGRRPGNLRQGWQPSPVMLPLLDFFEKTARAADLQGPGARLEACGVKLGGIRPDELRPGSLRHITVYTYPELPDQQVRLMPGNPSAASPRERVPYVVHTSDGVPLFINRMASTIELLPSALIPMHQFNEGMPRQFDFVRTGHIREKHMDTLLKDLLEHRASSPEAWVAGNDGVTGNLELIMQIFQDGRLPEALQGRDPASLTRGEALASELARLCLLAECGVEPGPHIGELVQFATRLLENKSDMKLLRLTLRRVVSPFPNQYDAAELQSAPAESTPAENHVRLD